MIFLVFTGLTIAKIYYGDINKSEDPRVIETKSLYSTFNSLNGDFDGMLLILDSIEDIYKNYKHYSESYEVGVVYNNRAAIFLSRALQEGDSLKQQILFVKANQHCNTAIEIYNSWKELNSQLTEQEIEKKILPHFNKEELTFKENRRKKIIKKRIEDIKTAQFEIDRRLSVSYTNLGITQRHTNHPKLSAESYTNAIKLWEENLTAKNNLNLLLGKPIEKRSFIRKLFPPDKEENSTN